MWVVFPSIQLSLMRLCFRQIESLCVILIDFNTCEWDMINMFERTLNVCVKPMGTALYAKACVIRNTYKKKDVDQIASH